MKRLLLLVLFSLSCMSSALAPTVTLEAYTPTVPPTAGEVLVVSVRSTLTPEVLTMHVCPDVGFLNVRVAAGTSAEVITALDELELVTVYEINAAGWARIGVNRWVNADYLCL